MIIPLRQRHFTIWIILAIVLPIFVILSLIYKPRIITDNFERKLPQKLSTLLGSSDTKEFTFNIRTDGIKYQLEVIIKTPLTSPSLLIYQQNNDRESFEDNQLIGALGPKGTYRFDLQINPTDSHIPFTLYDHIKKSIIQNIEITL